MVAFISLENSSDFASPVIELKLLLDRSKHIISSYGDNDIDGFHLGVDKDKLLLTISSASNEKERSNEIASPYTTSTWDQLGTDDGYDSEGSIATPFYDCGESVPNKVIAGSCTSTQIPIDSESDSGDDLSTESDTDIFSILKCRTECLLDLVPTLESSLAHSVKAIPEPIATKTPFSVAETARPFILRIADQFPKANMKLVERLGEANWQLYMQIRDRLGDSRPMTPKGLSQPFFAPSMPFRDSGEGASITAVPKYTSSAASCISLVASNNEENLGSLRVPRTPIEVSTGQPFQCFICNNILSEIRSRTDWK